MAAAALRGGTVIDVRNVDEYMAGDLPHAIFMPLPTVPLHTFELDRHARIYVIVVHVRPAASRHGRCARCRRRSSGFDRGDGRRRWRDESQRPSESARAGFFGVRWVPGSLLR